jgi:hypothetical protein
VSSAFPAAVQAAGLALLELERAWEPANFFHSHHNIAALTSR